MVVRKTPREIEVMARAGDVLAAVHEVLRKVVWPGMATADLEEIAAGEIRKRAFWGTRDCPPMIRVSVNDEIAYGVPSHRRRIAPGDVVSIDCGVDVEGCRTAAACTWVAGGRELAGEPARRLVDGTYQALWRGIAALRPGGRLGDVSWAVRSAAEQHRLGVVAAHDGHHVGGHRTLHEGPMMLSSGRPGRGMRLRPGLVFTIEPMFVLGRPGWRQPAGERAMSSLDGSLAAHWKHTVAVTESGPRVLTARPAETEMFLHPRAAADT